MGIFDGFLNLITKRSHHVEYRLIKEVDSWSGAASNYSTAEAYANASLINFNPQVRGSDTSDWVKTLVKLPVREEGDSQDTYIRQAVYAAAGGRGLSAITQPDGVTSEEFESARRQAAEELITVYEEMGEIAPDSIFEIAGREPERKRAVAMYSVWNRVNDALLLADMAEGTYSQLIDIYIDENELFALAIREGRLIRMDLVVVDNDVFLGDVRELEFMDDDAEMGRSIVYRQADGRFRFLCVASTSALNRVGEIDSRALFDSFIEYANASGDYPILNFYHQGTRSRLGKVDYLARDEHVYLASGLFDDNEFGRAAAEGVDKEPGYWGNSIEFKPLEGEMLRLIERGVNVTIPVFTKGINTAISLLPEGDAAALFTSYSESVGGQRMNAEVKESVLRLFNGDEELAERFEATVDAVNREVDTMIHRSNNEVVADQEEEVVEREVTEETEAVVETETEEAVEREVTENEAETVEEEATEEATEEVVEEEGTPEIVLDDDFVPSVANELVGYAPFIRALHEMNIQANAGTNDAVERAQVSIEALLMRLNELERSLTERIAVLEADEEQKRMVWQEDKPAAKPQVVVSYRARNNAPEEDEAVSMADKAKDTLRAVYGS